MAELPIIGDMSKNRKKAVFIVCLCLFAGTLTYRIMNPFEQGRVEQLTFTGGKGKPSAGKPANSMAAATPHRGEVLIDLYMNPPSHSGKVSNNVFFQRKEPVVQPKVPLPTENKPLAAAPPPTPAMQKRLKAQEDLSRFKSFGYMQKGNQKVLFLERGKDIMVVREGDRIDGKYLVKRITEKVLTIRAENIDEDVSIELGEF